MSFFSSPRQIFSLAIRSTAALPSPGRSGPVSSAPGQGDRPPPGSVPLGRLRLSPAIQSDDIAPEEPRTEEETHEMGNFQGSLPESSLFLCGGFWMTTLVYRNSCLGHWFPPSEGEERDAGEDAACHEEGRHLRDDGQAEHRPAGGRRPAAVAEQQEAPQGPREGLPGRLPLCRRAEVPQGHRAPLSDGHQGGREDGQRVK